MWGQKTKISSLVSFPEAYYPGPSSANSLLCDHRKATLSLGLGLLICKMKGPSISDPPWFHLEKELFMSWQEGQRKGWGRERREEVINGSQILAFDQVVWSEVRGQEMRWWEEERKQR